MENAQIAKIFDEIADLLEVKGGNAFKVRSYRNAARTVRDHSQRLEDLVKEEANLTKLPNVGQSMADKIPEIIETGTCERLEELQSDIPEELTDLLKVPQLGPRKAMQVYEELGVQSLSDLKEACEKRQIRNLEGFGAKTEKNILEGLQTIESISGRMLLKEAADQVESLGRHLDRIDAIKRWEVAGSFRRGKETVGDLDILIEAKDRDDATKSILKNNSIDKTISRGEERVSVLLASGLQIDFRFFSNQNFGSALMYFTGSKAHNVKLRQKARKNDWKLNEYGLSKNDKLLAARTEESVYQRLKLPWIPPELREDRGEIEAAEKDDLPDLIELEDIQGEMHCHTKASDGADTIRDMAEAGRKRGYKYLAITDHSKAVRVANGLDEKRVKKHAEEIREVDRELKDFWLMAGIEVDILPDGKLDLDEKVLADLDWVIASIHYNRNLSPGKMTDRIISAVRSGVVHCLGHPLGRMIGQRDPLAFDFEKVVEACIEENVVLEIDAQPDRLDLPDTFCQEAKRAGATFSIGTDSHQKSNLDFIGLGISMARRGWLEKKDVLNTKTTKQLKKAIER